MTREQSIGRWAIAVAACLDRDHAAALLVALVHVACYDDPGEPSPPDVLREIAGDDEWQESPLEARHRRIAIKNARAQFERATVTLHPRRNQG